MTCSEPGAPSRRTGIVIGRAAALTALIAGLVACTGGGDSPPAPEPSGPPPQAQGLSGRIVVDDEGDVFSLNADGTDRRQLTSHPELDFDPVWSPDGTRIAFRSHRDGNEEVYVMNADGSEQRNLSDNPASDYSPAWSPDGARIAFASNRDGDPNEIYVMDADGSSQTRVTDNPGIDEYPSWSPDGSRIAFNCTGGRVLPVGVGDFEICVVNADGTGLVQLTDGPGLSHFPDWSPEGVTIVFESDREGWPTLPEYTPPGYSADRYGEDELYVMMADGSGQTKLFDHDREDDSFPTWSPDGTLILFTRYGTLLVVRPDGSGLAALPTEALGGFPDWAP